MMDYSPALKEKVILLNTSTRMNLEDTMPTESGNMLFTKDKYCVCSPIQKDQKQKRVVPWAQGSGGAVCDVTVGEGEKRTCRQKVGERLPCFTVSCVPPTAKRGSS